MELFAFFLRFFRCRVILFVVLKKLNIVPLVQWLTCRCRVESVKVPGSNLVPNKTLFVSCFFVDLAVMIHSCDMECVD